MDMILSDKYKDFLRHRAKVEFMEGTTYSGKTTVGVLKFMLYVAQSDKKMHILSGLDTGTIEKNIINKDLGIVDVFGSLVEYNASGKGEHSMPHIAFNTSNGLKIIYVLGYDNKARWKKVLGGQYGGLYVDEINIADMEYIREISIRCDYMLATLNPDAPNLPIYTEYINHARPIDKYKDDAPRELLNMLDKPHKQKWSWWYFSFKDNAGLTDEKREQIISSAPVGTKLYKNKILGIRGKSTGLVFLNFRRDKHLISRSKALQWVKGSDEWKTSDRQEWFATFSAGLDTAYSSESKDTIAMSFIGITNKGRFVLLNERVYNNKDLDTPIAPSDTVINFIAFMERNRNEWGFGRDTFIDSADQATKTEFQKYVAKNGSIYTFNNAWKKTTIIDRINLQLGWMAYDDETGKEPVFLVVDDCVNYIGELESYSWMEDKDNKPEDRNDHMVNSVQYAFLPYKTKIGV